MDIIIITFIVKRCFLSLLVLLMWNPGCTGEDEVKQTSVLWVKQGDNATMDCSHTKGSSYYQMYWLRQLPGDNMERVVFTTTGSAEHDFGRFSPRKFAAAKTVAETGTFTVKTAQPEDQGLYFCAVSAQ